ncbi:MAG: AMP-binding protein [Betaproteobacteria bacterium]|nr:AMP-binding protein [Betaproteobacteria bacterium]
MNIGSLLTRTARLYPDRIGLVKGDERRSWSQLEDSANGLARALVALGIRPGERVLAQCVNNRWMLESQYAVMRTRAIYVPINPRAIPRETAHMVALARARAIIVDEQHVEHALRAAQTHAHVAHVIATVPAPQGTTGGATWHVYDALAATHRGETLQPAVRDADICMQMFTSGTTGIPKGALHSHGSLSAALIGRVADVMPGLGRESTLLVIGPLSHGTGTTCTACVMRGAKVVMLDSERFDVADCWRLIEAERISEIFTVPTILMDLARHPDALRRDRSSLRHVIYAGASLNRVDQHVAMQVFGPVLVQYYGATENMGTGTVLYPDMHSLADGDPHAPAGSCGVARSGVEIEIRDAEGRALPDGQAGAIWVRGPASFHGYYEMPEATAAALQDGWVDVGDLGRLDERGFLYIEGRSKEMYKSGGLQVYPNETQNHLAEHPAVAEAHVLSFPDSRWGEIGVGVVTLKPGGAASEAELREYLRGRLAAYKLPRRIWIWTEIPRNPVGKVPKPLLRDELLKRGLVRAGEDIPAA